MTRVLTSAALALMLSGCAFLDFSMLLEAFPGETHLNALQCDTSRWCPDHNDRSSAPDRSGDQEDRGNKDKNCHY